MYTVEICDRVHEDVVVSSDNLMGCVEDALSEWMDANGEDLTARTEAMMQVFIDEMMWRKFRLDVVSLDDVGSDAEPLLDLVVSAHHLAALEDL